MFITPKEIEQKHRIMRIVIHSFMALCMIAPVGGLVTMIFGFVEPGDMGGSMSFVTSALILVGVIVLIAVMWKVFLCALRWIVAKQISLLCNKTDSNLHGSQ